MVSHAHTYTYTNIQPPHTWASSVAEEESKLEASSSAKHYTSLSSERGSPASELCSQWTLKLLIPPTPPPTPHRGQIGVTALPGLVWEAILPSHGTDASSHLLLLKCDDDSPGQSSRWSWGHRSTGRVGPRDHAQGTRRKACGSLGDGSL